MANKCLLILGFFTIYCILLFEIKQVSSNQHVDLFGTLIKQPHERPNLPKRPYIIGFIGGIASGKSTMRKMFEKMGAGTIDCDKLAHSTYEPGEECFYKIINEFGNEILNDEGRINRRKLGAIVFGDKARLQKLNEIVLPNLFKKAKLKIKDLYEKENRQIIILEAAILTKAVWENECHEIWSMMKIPPEVAVQRIMERNNLSEDQAKLRVASQSQVNNSLVIQHANVIFSSLGSFEYSQLQAEKAWKELLLRLDNPIQSKI